MFGPHGDLPAAPLENTGVPLVLVESEPNGHNLSVPQLNQGSRSGASSSTHSRSTPDRLFAQRGPIPRSPSRLRRSGSLTVLNNDQSVQSLPQPIRRVEIDLNGNEVASFQNVRQAFHGIAHSDPSPSRRDSTESHNNSPSHQTVPLRLFWPLHRARSHNDPFVTVDPYRFHFQLFSQELKELQRNCAPLTHIPILLRHIGLQTYGHLLLCLPSLYFARVSHIFEEAEVTRPEMQRMIDGVTSGLDLTHDWAAPNVSPALIRFKMSWEEFVDTVIQEWKSLNVVSALLISALLTMFQINDADDQPTTRTASLISLMCATWSLIYGGIYIIRFRTMRSMYKASSWAQEAQKTKTSILWNVWVLLALPAVWLTWSMITFFVAILAFVWTSGSANDNPQAPSARLELIPRTLITALFLLGLVYFVLIVRTFKAYGKPRARRVARDAAQRATLDATANTSANANSLGLTLGGTNGDANGGILSGVSDSSRQIDLEKGEMLEDRRRTRGSPGLGELGL